MSAFDSAWILLKGLEDYYVDMTGGDVYGHGLSHEEVDERIMQDFQNRGIDPQHFLDWKNYDEAKGSLIDDDPNSEAAQAFRNSLDDLAFGGESRMPEMDDDPFRMSRKDIQTQIMEMADEIARRASRKKFKNLFNEDGTGKPEFDKYGAMHRDRELPMFDQDRPQNKRLINATAPQMREREAALNAELDRRAEKRRSL